jgi:hypothetical protein
MPICKNWKYYEICSQSFLLFCGGHTRGNYRMEFPPGGVDACLDNGSNLYDYILSYICKVNLNNGQLTPNANGILPTGDAGHILNVGGIALRLIGGMVMNGVVQISSFSRFGL